MKFMFSKINGNLYNIKNTEHKISFDMKYKSESIYGSVGYIDVEINETDGGYSLVITETSPMGRKSVVCSYGQCFCTTNGYLKGQNTLIQTIDEIIDKINNNLVSYNLI